MKIGRGVIEKRLGWLKLERLQVRYIYSNFLSQFFLFPICASIWLIFFPIFLDYLLLPSLFYLLFFFFSFSILFSYLLLLLSLLFYTHSSLTYYSCISFLLHFDFLGIPQGNSESFQILKYDIGQAYAPHHDFGGG